MALVQCSECNNDVSDAAAACPKCGAPIPKTLDPDQESCPFCMTPVHADATVCPSCRAHKGYTHAQGRVYSKGQSIAMGIVVPGIVALIAFATGHPFGILVGLFFLIPVVLTARRLKKGPLWYQRTGPV